MVSVSHAKHGFPKGYNFPELSAVKVTTPPAPQSIRVSVGNLAPQCSSPFFTAHASSPHAPLLTEAIEGLLVTPAVLRRLWHLTYNPSSIQMPHATNSMSKFFHVLNSGDLTLQCTLTIWFTGLHSGLLTTQDCLCRPATIALIICCCTTSQSSALP